MGKKKFVTQSNQFICIFLVLKELYKKYREVLNFIQCVSFQNTFVIIIFKLVDLFNFFILFHWSYCY